MHRMTHNHLRLRLNAAVARCSPAPVTHARSGSTEPGKKSCPPAARPRVLLAETSARGRQARVGHPPAPLDCDRARHSQRSVGIPASLYLNPYAIPQKLFTPSEALFGPVSGCLISGCVVKRYVPEGTRGEKGAFQKFFAFLCQLASNLPHRNLAPASIGGSEWLATI